MEDKKNDDSKVDLKVITENKEEQTNSTGSVFPTAANALQTEDVTEEEGTEEDFEEEGTEEDFEAEDSEEEETEDFEEESAEGET